MSRVFKWSDIKEKRIPAAADFITAKQVVDSTLLTMVGAGILRGARAVGSFARRQQTVRSDYDVLYTPNPLVTDEVRKSMQDLGAAIGVDFNIVFSPIEWSEEEIGIARTPVTAFSFSCDTLKDNLIGEDPLVLLPAPQEMPRITPIIFIEERQKHFSEQTFFSQRQYEENIPLEMALESTPHLASLLMATRSVETGAPAMTKEDAIADLRRRLSPEYQLLHSVNFLLSVDAAYDSLLRRSMAGESTEAEYDGFIRGMTPNCRDAAYELYCELPRRLSMLLDASAVGVEGPNLPWSSRS